MLGPLGNQLSHRATDIGVGLLVGASERACRGALGLGGRPAPMIPRIVYGFSPEVVPVVSDASTARYATGYWASVDVREPGEDLRAFLERPGPVVSVGFGSIGNHPGQLAGIPGRHHRQGDLQEGRRV